MSIFSLIPAPVRKAARAVLPASWVDGLKEYILTRYYTPGFVDRSGPVEFWFRRYILRKPPKLHRLLYHVTDHCNLNCRGCTHFSNISPKKFSDPEQYRREMDRVAQLFSDITEIFLLGGEPLLHPDLATFVRITRDHFPDSRINVMTNGVLVTRAPDALWDAMRDTGAWLLCDDYPVGSSKEDIEELIGGKGVQIEWTEPRDEFFKLPIDLTGSQDYVRSFRQCRGIMNCPVLKDGRLYPCAYTAFIDIFEAKYDVEGISLTSEDSIAITEDPYDVMDFLRRPVPWCRHCDFDHKETYEWGRSNKTIDEWVACQPPTPGE